MRQVTERLIIDTNLWISFLLTKDYSKLNTILSGNAAILLYSHSLIDEFVAVAQRPKFKKYFLFADLNKLLLQMRAAGELIEVNSAIELCRDDKDKFLLSLAKDGNATHLITGDKDLLVIKVFEKLKYLLLQNIFLENNHTLPGIIVL